MSQSTQTADRAVRQSSPITFGNYLPAAEPTCAPEAVSSHLEFHWLAFVPPNAKPQGTYKTECELWRWHQGQWRSVFVPGTRFTPAELHEHGWRYCKPCEPLVAVIRS